MSDLRDKFSNRPPVSDKSDSDDLIGEIKKYYSKMLEQRKSKASILEKELSLVNRDIEILRELIANIERVEANLPSGEQKYTPQEETFGFD